MILFVFLYLLYFFIHHGLTLWLHTHTKKKSIIYSDSATVSLESQRSFAMCLLKHGLLRFDTLTSVEPPVEQQLRATEVWSFFQNPQWSFTVPPEGLQDRQHHSWHMLALLWAESETKWARHHQSFSIRLLCYILYIYINILPVDADLHPISVEPSDLTWIGQCLWSRSLFCSWNVKTFWWISACLAML